MAARAWKVGVVAVVLVGVAGACRQLVGIEDEPPTALVDAEAPSEAGLEANPGPRCGIAYSGASCEACLENSCCTAAGACARDTSCNELEGCLGRCRGDPACRALCVDQHRIRPDPFEAQLAACLAANCESPCGIQCGGLSQDYGADAAAGCQTCIGNKACAAARACAKDPGCQAAAWCQQTNPYLDGLQACDSVQDAATDTFGAFMGDLARSCLPACSFGDQWYCVGNLPLPTPMIQPASVTGYFYDSFTNVPIVNATLTACSQNDPTCSVVLSTATTDDGGMATLSFPGDMQAPGGTGYVEVTGANLFPSLIFWGYSLTQPSVTGVFDTATTTEAAALATVLQVQVDLSARAVVAVAVWDCDNARASGVKVDVYPKDPDTKVFYASGSGISTTAESTDSSGGVLIVNVPVSTKTVRITATPDVLGRPSSIEQVVVRAGALTQLGAYVTQ